ncbi:MAG: class I SAM-dependent methyltransferase, partial [Anaerolineae bacterium]|nr:class I SAM-dependent methyltransferase [Anaerolineae bacterium]
MNLLNHRHLAHSVHQLGNDYHLRIPRMFQQLGLLGIVMLTASILWRLSNPSIYAMIGGLVGVILMLPATLTLLITRSLLNRRFLVRNDIVKHAALRGDEQILDIGVGSGITLFGCVKHLTTGKGIGIDIYDPNAGGGTPEIFWKNARKEGIAERVELKQMDARHMTFNEDSFDLVISTFAFHHIGDSDSRRRAAQEIVRVLKPGGKVL